MGFIPEYCQKAAKNFALLVNQPNSKRNEKNKKAKTDRQDATQSQTV
ncbi:hypothetical protein [Dyadobacter beijingensis]|nr:hypothetical protein [Dyadobacter beijingensis]